jgi:hypothetical protein
MTRQSCRGQSSWMVPLKRSNSHRKIEAHQSDAAAEPIVTRPVVRTAEEGTLLHCYLACGHMLTFHRDDLKEPSPPSIKCWACEEESKLGFPLK